MISTNNTHAYKIYQWRELSLGFLVISHLTMCQKHGRLRKRCKVDKFGQEVWHVEGVFNQILWKMASDGKTEKHIKSLFDI